MKFDIHNLKNGIHTFEIITSRDALNLKDNEIFVNEIKVKNVIEKKDNNIFVNVHIETHANYVCDKCLANFENELLEDFALLYKLERDLTKYYDHDYHEEEGVRFINPNSVEIDLTADVRESLLLAIPMKVVCSEDCKGLCRTCGTNLNEEMCQCVQEEHDPRWEPLKKLLDER
ncbi:MAG: DUF177 domain-containing protein [bacterium]